MKKKIICDSHRWVETDIRDPNFHVKFGAMRVCMLCGAKQVCSFCEGRIGGPWRDIETCKTMDSSVR